MSRCFCDAVVSHVVMSGDNRARGIRYIERYSNRSVEIDARVVILAGSTLENTRLLLNSERGGLANSSSVLGQYLMDQVSGSVSPDFCPFWREQQSAMTTGKRLASTFRISPISVPTQGPANSSVDTQ